MAEIFNPYIEGALPLLASEVDDHVANTPVVYYGELPQSSTAEARLNLPAITVEDNSGKTDYSVLISGDLNKAKRILVKTMSWSEHPGRGFEALREVLISNEDIAVVGISFPGAGMDGQSKMTHDQWRSLNKKGGDFSFISEQQWQAIVQALTSELGRTDSKKSLTDFEFVIGGSSLGASNVVGLLQSLPEGIRVAGVALTQPGGMEVHNRATAFGRMSIRFCLGVRNSGLYVAANPYTEYPALGPKRNIAKNVLTRPASHIGATVGAMARGGDLHRLLGSMNEKEIMDATLMLATTEHDHLGSPAEIHRAAKTLRESGVTVPEPIIWIGHYHHLMKNLSNSRSSFRDQAGVDLAR